MGAATGEQNPVGATGDAVMDRALELARRRSVAARAEGADEVSLYVVVGYEASYYSDGFYFRYHDGTWQLSATFGDGWKKADTDQIPKKLKTKHSGKGKGKGNKHDD